MQSDRAKVSNFAESLFQGMQDVESFSFFPSAENSENTEDPMVIEFRRRMGILVTFLDDWYHDEIAIFFTIVDVTWKRMVDVMISHCLAICERRDDVFKAFLHVCSFIYIVLRYAQSLYSTKECLTTAKNFVTDVFDFKMKDKFREQGGWDKFESFSKTCDIDEIIDLVTTALDGSTFAQFSVVIDDHPNDVPFPSILIPKTLNPSLYVKQFEKFLIQYFNKEVCRKNGKNLKNPVKRSFQNLECTLERVLAKAKETKTTLEDTMRGLSININN